MNVFKVNLRRIWKHKGFHPYKTKCSLDLVSFHPIINKIHLRTYKTT